MEKDHFKKIERKTEAPETPDNMAYKSLMTEQEIKKRKDFQDKVYYSELRRFKGERDINVLGIDIHISEGVFSSQWEDSRLLAETVKQNVDNKDYVLDLGTGSGIQAIFSAKNGAKVVATDINEKSIECAKDNARKHGLDKKITVKKSDLFDNLAGESFDKIIFNPPFRWFKPRDMLERASLDENYDTLQKFMKEAKNYLKQNGSIILVFSTSGDIKYFEKLVQQNKYQATVLNRSKKDEWDYFVYELRA